MNNNQEILAQLPTVVIETLPDARNSRSGRARFEARIPAYKTLCIITDSGSVVVARRGLRFGRHFRFLWDEPACDNNLVAGQSYPFVDEYFSYQINIVLDRHRRWERTEFRPSDAFSWKVPGGTYVTPAYRYSSGSTSDELVDLDLSEATRVEGAWDHEHCAICSQCICLLHGAWGYVSSANTWVCEACFDRIVTTRSLAFLLNEREVESRPSRAERKFLRRALHGITRREHR